MHVTFSFLKGGKGKKTKVFCWFPFNTLEVIMTLAYYKSMKFYINSLDICFF